MVFGKLEEVLYLRIGKYFSITQVNRLFEMFIGLIFYPDNRSFFVIKYSGNSLIIIFITQWFI